jgi:hypothetical protein
MFPKDDDVYSIKIRTYEFQKTLLELKMWSSQKGVDNTNKRLNNRCGNGRAA